MISRILRHFLLLVVLICPTARTDPYRFLALSKHFLTSSGFFATAYCQNHGKKSAHLIELSASPQRFPQYVEVPPNIEVKQIVSFVSMLLPH